MPKSICAAAECTRSTIARGLCTLHYRRAQKSGSLPPTLRDLASPTCTSEACEQPAYLKDLCRRHYEVDRESAGICAIAGCGGGVRARGVCGAHYQVLRRAGLPECAIPDCDQKSVSKGLCGRHYGQDRLDRMPPCEVAWCAEPAKFLGLCATHYSQQHRLGYIVPDEISCMTCGGLFRRSTYRMQASTVTCLDCQIRSASVRWCMSVQQIAERDGTRCVLCRKEVDMTLKRPDLMSPSVEHVIPRAFGGKDIPSNVALAHLLCNMRAGGAMGHVKP